jgi:uncharacterized RDD family membrane protein YckC
MSTPVPYGRVSEAGIVTPEAVVLDFQTGGLGSRAVAEVVDLLVQAGIFGILALGFVVLGSTAVGEAGVYFSLFAVLFVYPITVETLSRGRSVGKLVMGLRVVTIEGAPISFRHALIRGSFALVDFYGTGGAVAVLSVLLTRRNQRLGDLAAGTLVLRIRTGAPAPRAATFSVPPGWEAYAATIDVRALTATEYQAARAFLLRAPTLDAVIRDQIARSIATPLAARLRHTPPPGIPAEQFLLCVAARYQAVAPRLGG